MRTRHNCTYLAIGAVLSFSFSFVHAADQKKTNASSAVRPAPSPAIHAAPSGGGGSGPKLKPSTGTGSGVHTYKSNTGTGSGIHTSTANTGHPSGTTASKSTTSHPSGTTASKSTTSHPSGTTASKATTSHPSGTTASKATTSKATTSHPSGTTVSKATTSHPPSGITRSPNGKVWRDRNGSEAKFGKDGKIRTVNTRGMTIVHGRSGGRQVLAVRTDHSRIFTNGAGHGYVQHPFSYRGHEYARRTYYSQGRSHSSYYRSYSYGNAHLFGYSPAHYYSQGFYGWAYHPWAQPWNYGGWGWAGSPWYAYYGGYFSPWRSYPGAAFWLTDYLIASSLQDAWQQQVDAGAAAQAQANSYGGGTAALGSDVKQAIADEVQRQLALENSERQQVAQNIEPDPASSGLPRMLADGVSHVFVVSSTLDVSDSNGQSCEVSEGDVLQLQTPPPQNASAGLLNVLASKGQDCPRGAVVTVAFEDLQEMQNHMRETIDGGLGQLQGQAGQGGLQAAPPGANAPPMQSAFAPIAPPPDPNVASELSQQAGAAAAAEQQVISDANAAGNQ
ncbi:MAG: hypothetical protein ABSF98_13255 [Bryobacteraceae bacterium]